MATMEEAVQDAMESIKAIQSGSTTGSLRVLDGSSDGGACSTAGEVYFSAKSGSAWICNGKDWFSLGYDIPLGTDSRPARCGRQLLDDRPPLHLVHLVHLSSFSRLSSWIPCTSFTSFTLFASFILDTLHLLYLFHVIRFFHPGYPAPRSPSSYFCRSVTCNSSPPLLATPSLLTSPGSCASIAPFTPFTRPHCTPPPPTRIHCRIDHVSQLVSGDIRLWHPFFGDIHAQVCRWREVQGRSVLPLFSSSPSVPLANFT